MPLQPVPDRSDRTDAPGRREQQRLETRQRIYEAALDEFRREGFGNAQIDRIVERAGVARGTFYFHFPTKEHVLLELQRRSEASLIQRFAAFRDRSLGVREFLAQMIEAMVAETRSLGDPALAREITAMYVRAPRYVEFSTEPFIVSLVDYFTEAAERGEVRSDLSPEEVALMFLNILFGFIVGAVDSLEARLEEFDRVIDVFARGIAP